MTIKQEAREMFDIKEGKTIMFMGDKERKTLCSKRIYFIHK